MSRRAFLRSLTGQAADMAALPFAADAVMYDTPVITPVGRFYVEAGRGIPPAPVLADWRLAVDGLVGHSQQFTYDNLLALPAEGRMITLAHESDAPGGERIGNAMWRGFTLQALLDRVAIQPAAHYLNLACTDGYQVSLPMVDADPADVLLAYSMNGARLPLTHGFPLRLLTPGVGSAWSVKWLARITAAAEPGPDHAAASGIRTRAQIMMPPPFGSVEAGQAVALQGVAFAGLRRITVVEVCIDGGPWMPVILRLPDSPAAWTQWYVYWTPALPGEYAITVRATDDTGESQPPATWHTITVYVT
jgi:DMSO/TMAO reductase YedYZ molybdopterin-dependent catalytic subunit